MTAALERLRDAAAQQDAAERARSAAARAMRDAAFLAHREGLTFEQIGAAIGVSTQRASYLAKHSIKRS